MPFILAWCTPKTCINRWSLQDVSRLTSSLELCRSEISAEQQSRAEEAAEAQRRQEELSLGCPKVVDWSNHVKTKRNLMLRTFRSFDGFGTTLQASWLRLWYGRHGVVSKCTHDIPWHSSAPEIKVKLLQRFECSILTWFFSFASWPVLSSPCNWGRRSKRTWRKLRRTPRHSKTPTPRPGFWWAAVVKNPGRSETALRRKSKATWKWLRNCRTGNWCSQKTHGFIVGAVQHLVLSNINGHGELSTPLRWVTKAS